MKVFGMSDIEEKDESGINILGNDASLCLQLEEEARSFLQKKDIKLNQLPVVDINKVQKIESFDITKFQESHGSTKKAIVQEQKEIISAVKNFPSPHKSQLKPQNSKGA